ncbi:MAG: hypothetical protein ACSHXZ_07060 [Gammaproteobacteria bacterium]
MNLKISQTIRVQQGAAKHLVLLFALLFLVLQTSTLIHSHNGDLHHHLDCTICLKVGAGSDALRATPFSFTPSKAQHRYEPLLEQLVFVARVPANSRGPPHYS